MAKIQSTDDRIGKMGQVTAMRLASKFHRWITTSSLIVSFAAALSLSAPANAQARDIILDDGIVTELKIPRSTTLTIQTNIPFTDILIGDTGMVDVFPLTDTSLYIQAKSNGLTNVTLYDEEKRLLEVIAVRVLTDFSELERAIERAVPNSQVSVSNVNDRIRLSGNVRDNVDQFRILEIAQQFSGDPVINAMRVKSAQQVELDVRILEVERNSGRSLGVDLTSSDGAFSTTGGVAAPFGTVVGELLEVSGVDVDFVIDALETKGLARRLANPKLVTTSGIEANFVVGGEIPIQSASTDENGNVATTTDYREYGVRLNFLPQVLDNELIRLRISPEVSDVDLDTTREGGLTSAAFITRKADTTVSLRNGQSFAIAGLLQANNARNISQFPWLGQIPVLGSLFSSRSFEKRETDLVILVTPRLVRPTASDTPLVSPLDGTRSSNDIELFLLGMLEVDRRLLRTFREGEGVVGPYGHIIDLEFDDGVIKKK